MKLDELDKNILELLQENAKLGTKEIAARIGLTVTPTYERIKRLEKSGIIQSYTTVLNKKMIGKNIQVFSKVSLKEHRLEMLEKFESSVVKLPQVTSCYHIAGDHDYALFIEVESMDAYEEFLREHLATIPSIANVESSFVMREVK